MRRRPFANAAVAGVFETYPRDVRTRLLELRELIFDTAAATAGVGPLEETLRWGEPSYLTTESKSGSMVRMHWKPSDGDSLGMYFHCQTSLVSTFRELYPTEFRFEGNRSLRFERAAELPLDPLCHCIALALTYHLDRRTLTKAERRR